MKIMKICANFNQTVGEMKHFWRSMGTFPGALLLHPGMQQFMTYASSIPNGGITYVRSHYLLELVKVRNVDTESPEYDWSRLDKAMDVLVHNNLKPFFEVMGNPSGYFDDFLDKIKIYAWKRLVRDMALHFIDRYGIDEVMTWYFESWNEPDGHWFEGTAQAYLNYFDACSEGLKEADNRLVFGGPGTCHTLSDAFKNLLQHCDTGTNYFTGKQDVRIDFISVHEKGAPPCIEDLDPDSAGICEREIRAIEYIQKNHPKLANKPFMNNECDPQIGWNDYHTWHARPYYAAMICKMTNQHLVSIIDESRCDYRLMSNDNCFLGRWGNRTLLACFGENLDLHYDGKEFLTRVDPFEKIIKSEEFALIKKPVFNAMVMLSKLGNQRIGTNIAGGLHDDIGVIATMTDDDQIAVLIYNSSDKIMNGGVERIELSLEGLPFSEAALAHYRIDDQHGDPYRIWEKSGDPWLQQEEVFKPREPLLTELRENQELVLFDDLKYLSITEDRLDLSFDLPLMGVSLILLSKKPETAPARVRRIKAERYKSIIGKREIMLSWDCPDSKFIQTFEVLYADHLHGPFHRINKQDLICTAYLHARDLSIEQGFYKIQAVDYWGRTGEASEVIEV